MGSKYRVKCCSKKVKKKEGAGWASSSRRQAKTKQSLVQLSGLSVPVKSSYPCQHRKLANWCWWWWWFHFKLMQLKIEEKSLLCTFWSSTLVLVIKNSLYQLYVFIKHLQKEKFDELKKNYTRIIPNWHRHSWSLSHLLPVPYYTTTQHAVTY